MSQKVSFFKKLLLSSALVSQFLNSAAPVMASGTSGFSGLPEEEDEVSGGTNLSSIPEGLHDREARLPRDPEAQFSMAERLLTGPVKNPQAARFWFEKAANQNHPSALYRLGDILYAEGGEAKERGFKLLQEAAAFQVPEAQNLLGVILKGRAEDEERYLRAARFWFEQAANQKNPPALYNLGSMLVGGEGGDQHKDEGIRLLIESERLGFENAKTYLEALLEDGFFSEAEVRQAREQLDAQAKAKAQNPHTPSAAAAAVSPEPAAVAPVVTPPLSSSHVEEAAYPKSSRELYNLARMLYCGEGDAVEKRLSVTLFRKAAELGNPEAQAYLGVILQEGKCAERDYKEARELFEKAALQKYPRALFSLGLDLYFGTGGDPDKERGLMLLLEAEELGIKRAQNFLEDRLTKGTVSEEEIQKARERLEQTRTTQQKTLPEPAAAAAASATSTEPTVSASPAAAAAPPPVPRDSAEIALDELLVTLRLSDLEHDGAVDPLREFWGSADAKSRPALFSLFQEIMQNKSEPMPLRFAASSVLSSHAEDESEFEALQTNLNQVIGDCAEPEVLRIEFIQMWQKSSSFFQGHDRFKRLLSGILENSGEPFSLRIMALRALWGPEGKKGDDDPIKLADREELVPVLRKIASDMGENLAVRKMAFRCLAHQESGQKQSKKSGKKKNDSPEQLMRDVLKNKEQDETLRIHLLSLLKYDDKLADILFRIRRDATEPENLKRRVQAIVDEHKSPKKQATENKAKKEIPYEPLNSQPVSPEEPQGAGEGSGSWREDSQDTPGGPADGMDVVQTGQNSSPEDGGEASGSASGAASSSASSSVPSAQGSVPWWELL